MKPVCIVEGFEMLGKTQFIKSVLTPEGYSWYHPTHDLTDRTVGRNFSWIMGYGLIDFLSQTIMTTPLSKYAIDRGVVSSYVYPKLFGESQELDDNVLEWYKDCKFFHDHVDHYLFKHESRESAEEIYRISQGREVVSNIQSKKYDTYKSFDDYWEKYLCAQDLFKKGFERVGVRPIVVTTHVGCWILKGKKHNL